MVVLDMMVAAGWFDFVWFDSIRFDYNIMDEMERARDWIGLGLDRMGQ